LGGGLTRCNIGLHLLKIGDAKRLKSLPAQERADMSLDTDTIGCQRADLDWPSLATEQTTAFGLPDIPIADLTHRDRTLPSRFPLANWIGSRCCGSQDFLGERASLIDRNRPVASQRLLPKHAAAPAARSIPR
jgi:hypothetical protein